MGRRRVISPGRRNAGLVRFVVLVLAVFVVGLLLGFLLGRISGNREEAAPPAPPARTVTVEKTVPASEKTIEKTVPAPEQTIPTTTTTTSASATASP
jgi:hypothetical protein